MRRASFRFIAFTVALALTACDAGKPKSSIQAAADSLTATVAEQAAACGQAGLGAARAYERTKDANLVSAAGQTCNAAAAMIEGQTVPAGATSEQAELFARALHSCGQAQVNVAMYLGVMLRGRALTEADKASLRHIDRNDRHDACVEDFEAAHASLGGSIARADRERLKPPSSF